MRSKDVSPRLNLIAAIDTLGEIYLSIMQANGDTETFCLFMAALIKRLEIDRPGFRENHCFILDGAPSHTSDTAKVFLSNLRIKIFLLSPYR